MRDDWPAQLVRFQIGSSNARNRLDCSAPLLTCKAHWNLSRSPATKPDFTPNLYSVKLLVRWSLKGRSQA